MYERSVDAARRGVRAYSDVLRRLLRARVVSFSKNSKRDGQQLLAIPFWFANSCFTCTAPACPSSRWVGTCLCRGSG